MNGALSGLHDGRRSIVQVSMIDVYGFSRGLALQEARHPGDTCLGAVGEDFSLRSK